MMNRVDGSLGVARAFGDFMYKVFTKIFIINLFIIIIIIIKAKKYVII